MHLRTAWTGWEEQRGVNAETVVDVGCGGASVGRAALSRTDGWWDGLVGP